MANLKGTNYGNDSIKALKGAERVRKRPEVMFGSADLKGAFHSFKEILGNSLDEARAGFGKEITVIYHVDGAISVMDNGRGVPMGWNASEGRYNWDLVFNDLYAGGKYDPDEGDYKFSVGLNGLGAACVQYTSEYFEVTSWSRDTIASKKFAKGEPLDDGLVEEPNNTGKTGTTIKWKVDKEIFSDVNFKFDMFKEYCEGQAHINEVNFKLIDEATGEEVFYEGKGVEHYLRSQLGDAVLDVITKHSSSKGIERGTNYTCECELVLAITNECKSKQLYFHNTSTMVTGEHLNAVEDAITAFFKDIAKKNGCNILPYDYQDYLSVLVSTYSNITSFANQTKDGVSNRFIYSIIYSTIKDALEEAVVKGVESVSVLVDNVVRAALARKRAKEIEAQERLVKRTTNKRAKAEKFVDCKESDPAKRELFIVEGDSALSSCKQSRDGSFQALIPVRGKTLNCLKASMEDILKNQIVQDIISTVGTGADIGSDNELFDINKLQYNKIIFCTDGDVDGFQIRVLLYTVFYRLMPQLLRDGYVYVVETPLFEIITSKGTKFAYSVEEKDEIVADCEKNHIAVKKINRSKGLGENDPDMMWNTTMNPDTRKLVPLDIDIRNTLVRDISNMLFGNDPDNGRKDFIFDMLGTGLQELDGLDTLVETVNALVGEESEVM